MRVLRQSGIVKRAGVWSALVATLLHVALLSLHVTANFERAIAAPGDLASLSVHALCGPGLSGQLPDDGSGLPGQTGKSASSCPICTGAAPATCLSPPDALLAPVIFNTAAAPPPPAVLVPAVRRQHFAGSIRGPPALV